MVMGMWIRSIVFCIASSPVLSGSPSGRLNDIEVDTEVPVWLTLTGVVLVVLWLKAENGMTVSLFVITDEPVEVLKRPAFARELAAKLRATPAATEALLAATVPRLLLNDVVPATAWVACVPLTEPPEVLIYSSFRTSGFCQISGATSMTTWYCWGLKGLLIGETCA